MDGYIYYPNLAIIIKQLDTFSSLKDENDPNFWSSHSCIILNFNKILIFADQKIEDDNDSLPKLSTQKKRDYFLFTPFVSCQS